MGHANMQRRSARKSVSSWLWSATVAALAAIMGMAGLDALGRAPSPPLLRASFMAAPAAPDVQLQPIVVPEAPPPPPPPPVAQVAPARSTRPVSVPKDPYAREPIQEIGTLEIPKLGVKQRLMEGITLRNIDFGPSHWPGTALPGEAGNMVVAGHRVTHSKPFRNVDQLVAGDEIIVTAHGQQATYRMTTTFIVTPDRTDIADPTSTPTLTLFACHPPGSARQRIVVRAQLASSPAV